VVVERMSWKFSIRCHTSSYGLRGVFGGSETWPVLNSRRYMC
jgi:hypothetical protein